MLTENTVRINHFYLFILLKQILTRMVLGTLFK